MGKFQVIAATCDLRLFFTPVMSEIEALQTLQKMMLDALHDAPDAAGNKHGTRNSPAKLS